LFQSLSTQSFIGCFVKNIPIIVRILLSEKQIVEYQR